MSVLDPLVLKDAHNTVVWLRPLPVVAKVATSPLKDPAAGLRLERDVLAHLAGTDASVSHLAKDLPAELHHAGGCPLLLLDYIEHDPAAAIPPATAKRVLKSVQEALRTYPGKLPPFTEQTGPNPSPSLRISPYSRPR